MRIHVLTLFPPMFQGPFQHSLVRRAVDAGLVQLCIQDIRDYTHDSHHTADDYQHGGGPGMVMKPEPLFEAVEDALSGFPPGDKDLVPVVLLSPPGPALPAKGGGGAVLWARDGAHMRAL